MILIPQRRWYIGIAGVGKSMANRDFEYRIHEVDGWRRILSVSLSGGIFVSNLGDFTVLFDEARKSKPRDIVLDCDRLDFISSSGIGALLKLNGEFDKSSIRLWIAGLAPEIHNVFQQMNLDSIFRLEPTAADAVARIKKLGFPENAK